MYAWVADSVYMTHIMFKCYISGPLTLANLGGAPSLGERKLVVAQNEHHAFLIHCRVLQAHPSSHRVVGQGQLCSHHHLAGLWRVGSPIKPRLFLHKDTEVKGQRSD